MTDQNDGSLATMILEQRKLRKETFKNQSIVIRSYGHLLDKALSDNDMDQIREVRDDLYNFADKLKEMAEEV